MSSERHNSSRKYHSPRRRRRSRSRSRSRRHRRERSPRSRSRSRSHRTPTRDPGRRRLFSSSRSVSRQPSPAPVTPAQVTSIFRSLISGAAQNLTSPAMTQVTTGSSSSAFAHQQQMLKGKIPSDLQFRLHIHMKFAPNFASMDVH